MFTAQNELEYFIVKDFNHRFNTHGILSLTNSVFASAYEWYLRDFYYRMGCDVTDITLQAGYLHIQYYDYRSEDYKEDIPPLWSPNECIYYTLMDMGMNNTAKPYERYIGVDYKNRRPWQYKWEINWLNR